MTPDPQHAFAQDGFACAPPLYSAAELADVSAAMDRILAGQYETGVAPFSAHRPEHLTQPLVKIDNAQRADRTILAFLSDPRLGEWAARVSGARQRVQVWSTQLLVKRPQADAAVTAGGIGWHRDQTYWQMWEPGSVLFTAWIAVSDVRAECGPMCMVPGSQRWPDAAGGNFFSDDLEAVKNGFPLPPDATWRETPMVLAPGAVSFHHQRTIHGSHPNRSTVERRSFAVHLCTENARLVAGSTDRYAEAVTDPRHAPVIWEA